MSLSHLRDERCVRWRVPRENGSLLRGSNHRRMKGRMAGWRGVDRVRLVLAVPDGLFFVYFYIYTCDDSGAAAIVMKKMAENNSATVSWLQMVDEGIDVVSAGTPRRRNFDLRSCWAISDGISPYDM